MPDVSDLYPKAPQQQQGLLAGDPLKLLGAVGQLNQNALFQQIYSSREKVGEAYKNALKPDGTIDHPALVKGAANAGFLAPDTMTAVQAQEGQRIQNATAQFGLDVGQNQKLMDIFGALGDKKGGVTDEDIRNTVVTAARNSNIPSDKLSNLIKILPKDPIERQNTMNMIRRIALGTGAVATPTQTGIGTAGEPIKGTTGQFLDEANQPGSNAPIVPNRVTTQSIRPPGVPIGLGVGEQSLGEEGAKRAGVLQGTATTTQQYHADLDNLKLDSKILDNLGGPTADVEKKLNALTFRLGKFGVTMTPDQMAAADSFPKIANQIALNQGSAFGGTDAARSMSLGANPSLAMSRYGRDGVIDMLQGNQDAIDTTRKAWLKSGEPPSNYDRWLNDFGSKIDPRVFQFNRMGRENQQKFLQNLDPSELPEFERKYQSAINEKWVKPLKGQ